MPCKNYEPNENMENSNNQPAVEDNNIHADSEFVRELTLTDKLNKQLLQSFLERINQTGTQYASFVQSSEDQSASEDNVDEFA